MSKGALTIWFTGLPGAGKTTTAIALAKAIKEREGSTPFLLDGDHVRSGLSSDLGFSATDRAEQVRRAGEVALLAAQQGFTSLVSLVSPNADARDAVRRRHLDHGIGFVEIFVATPLEVCTARDPKKLYARAKAGTLKQMTGAGDPYEIPENPDLIIETHLMSTEKIVEQILAALAQR